MLLKINIVYGGIRNRLKIYEYKKENYIAKAIEIIQMRTKNFYLKTISYNYIIRGQKIFKEYKFKKHEYGKLGLSRYGMNGRHTLINRRRPTYISN